MISISPGAWVATAVDWLNTNFHGFFAAISLTVETVLGGIEALLLFAPSYVLIALLTLVCFALRGWRLALVAGISSGFCLVAGFWPEAMETVALVAVSVTLAVAISFPLGILSARHPRLESALRPVLDVMQTVPPWVYLIPAVMIFNLGKVPALIATVVYGIPPMLRITTLAFKEIPREFIELGQASGASPMQSLVKIELPAARKTLLVGLNQCILLSLAMVVLAGLVGAGGLGAEVTRGLTRMEMGLGLRAGLCIVAVAVCFDRITRAALDGRRQ